MAFYKYKNKIYNKITLHTIAVIYEMLNKFFFIFIYFLFYLFYQIHVYDIHFSSRFKQNVLNNIFSFVFKALLESKRKCVYFLYLYLYKRKRVLYYVIPIYKNI